MSRGDLPDRRRSDCSSTRHRSLRSSSATGHCAPCVQRWRPLSRSVAGDPRASNSVRSASAFDTCDEHEDGEQGQDASRNRNDPFRIRRTPPCGGRRATRHANPRPLLVHSDRSCRSAAQPYPRLRDGQPRRADWCARTANPYPFERALIVSTPSLGSRPCSRPEVTWSGFLPSSAQDRSAVQPNACA